MSRQWKPYAEAMAELADNGIKPREMLEFDDAELRRWCDKFEVWLPEDESEGRDYVKYVK